MADNFDAAMNRKEQVAECEEPHRGLLGRMQHLRLTNPTLVPLVVLLMSLTVFELLLGSRFFSPFALALILQQVAIVSIFAPARSLVILTVGIDLSVRAIAVLSSVIMGQFTF